MKLTAYIQMVESRADYVNGYIVPELRGMRSVGRTLLACDTERRGPLWNFVRICEDIARTSQVALILQDDVVLHHHFDRCLAELLPHVTPERPIWSLFPPIRKAFDGDHGGANVILNKRHMANLALLVETDFCRGFTREVDRTQKHDDLEVQRYLLGIKAPVHVPIPGLVQHNINLKSEMGHPSKIGGQRRMTRAWSDTIPEGHFRELRIKEL